MMRSECDRLINTTKVKEYHIIPNEHDTKVETYQTKSTGYLRLVDSLSSLSVLSIRSSLTLMGA